MEAQTDLQTYLDRGKQALAQGQGRDAALAYAHAAQLEPDNPKVHLGLAEANLALGSYGVVYMASRKVQELQPAGGIESSMAQALLNLLDRRYERALQDVNTVITDDPGNGYAHALRSYLLRLTGQDYDAGLARSRATRLSSGGKFENCFPPVDAMHASASGYGPDLGATTPVDGSAQADGNGNGLETSGAFPGTQREAVPPWSRPNTIQRRMVRTRFMLSRNPRFVTTIIIAINVLVYLVLALLAHMFDFTSGDGVGFLVDHGAQVNLYVMHGEYWRIFTAMFLHFSIIHIALNMLSLFFIGAVVEVVYGKWRYLLIYLLSGIAGGIVTLFVDPPGTVAAGASGAIFGVFGALGVFYLVNRRALGTTGGAAISNWIFWLAINLVFGFSNTSIGIWDHLGGLVAGMVIAALLTQRLGRRRSV